MRASNGYFEIELIEHNGVQGIKTYKNGLQFGRKKALFYDKNGEPFFKVYGIKYYINEFIRNDF